MLFNVFKILVMIGSYLNLFGFYNYEEELFIFYVCSILF